MNDPVTLQGGITTTPGAIALPSATPTEMSASVVPITDENTPSVINTPTPEPIISPYLWTDEIPVMSGICFEAAFDASGQVFVLRSPADHIRLYDLADNSALCRRPVKRNPFEFGTGERILAGLWSKGIGCEARHDIIDWAIEERTLKMIIQFITEGDCNYELVRPFWIGISDVDDVEITVLE